MILFVKLLLAHLLGDFLLQPSKWVADKEQKKHRSIYLYLHCLLHGALVFIFVGDADFIWPAILLAVVHGLVDYTKLHFQKPGSKRRWFIIDQLLHLLTIALVALYIHGFLYFNSPDNSFWILFTGIVFLTKPASISIKNIIMGWTPEEIPGQESLQNAGNYIGMLERLFVFGFILTDHFEAIGFLLAAKSIFRFGDLTSAKDRKLTEYVLIGTLLSFGLAIITGLLVQHAMLSASQVFNASSYITAALKAAC